MNKSVYPWLLVLAASIACAAPASDSAQPQANHEQDMAAIDKIRAAFVTAWKAGDAGAIANLYAEDATVMPANQPTASGHDAIMQYNAGFFEQFTPSDFQVMPEETKVIGDTAFDRGMYKLMATPKAGGESISDHGRYLILLQRQADGSWKVTKDIDNNDAPPAPSATPPAK